MVKKKKNTMKKMHFPKKILGFISKFELIQTLIFIKLKKKKESSDNEIII